MSTWLSAADVLAVHEDLAWRFGGAADVRDYGALEGALARCRSCFYDTVLERAAALWEALHCNHPFESGNERTAFASTLVFLWCNGYELQVSSSEALKFLENLRQLNAFTYANLLHGLRRSAVIRRAK